MSNIFSDKRKLFGTILGLIMFSLTIVSITYAYYSWRSSNTIVTFNIQDNIFFCETGVDSSVSNLSPVNDYRQGTHQSFIVKNIGRQDTTFSLTMNVTNISSDVIKHESFKYKLMLDPTGGSKNCASTSVNDCTLVGEGNFSNIQVGMNTLIQSITLPNNSKYQYYFFMYLDGTMSNPTGIQSQSMTSTLGVCDIYTRFDLSYIKLSSSVYQIGGSCASVSPDCLKLTADSTYATSRSCSSPNGSAVGLPTPTRSDTTISFNSNASGVSNPSNKTVKYDFSGWYNNNNFTGSAITNSTNVTTTENQVLYAKWTPNTSSSGSITLPTISRAGYIFDGWYTAASGGTRVGGIGDSYLPTDCTKTLYAHWTAISKTINIRKDNVAWSSSGVTIGLSTSNSVYITDGNDKTVVDQKVANTATVTFVSNDSVENGIIAAGTPYFVWVGKDSNHKSDMVYTGITFNGNDNTSPIANYYTLILRSNHVSSMGVNDSPVSDGGSVIVASNWPHNITSAADTGYSFASWSKTAGGGTVTFGDASQANTTANVTVNSATITANGVDSQNPTVTLTSTNNLKVASQTATLKCTDNVGVTAYYWGDTEPSAATSMTTTTAADLNSLKSSSGLSKPISSAGTYWLGCRDAVGNWDKKSVVIYDYTVNNMLQNTSGSTYTTTHYTQVSTNNYIAPSGTSIVGTSIYIIPTGSRSGRYAGISDGVASTTAATVNKTNRTLSANNAVYTIWFTRNVININVQVQDDETFTSIAGTYTWALDSNNIITRTTVSSGSSTKNIGTVRYVASGETPGTLNMYNYHNTSSNYDIAKEGHIAVSHAEYICTNCATANLTMDQDNFSPADTTAALCNASTSDCTVIFKVNWTPAPYNITISSNCGVNTLTASGWTGTGTSSISKTYNYGSTINLASIITPSFKNGYSGISYAKASGSGTLSDSTFTVGAGAATINANATALAAPTCGISGGDTKIYNYQNTTLTASNSTSFDSSVSLKYQFGYAANNTTAFANFSSQQTDATYSVTKALYRGTRYYGTKITATGCNSLSNTCTTATGSGTAMVLKNKKLTFNATANGGTLSGTGTLYIAYDNASVYTTATGSTAGTIPTATKDGYTFDGWYTTQTTGGVKVINGTGALVASATDGSTVWTSGSKWANISASDATLYARFITNSYTVSYASTAACPLPSGSSSTGYDSATVNFGDVINKANPTCTGYTFDGWTLTGGDTSTAKYGTTNNPTTAWVNKNKGTYFKNLASTTGATPTMTANWVDSAAPTITLTSTSNLKVNSQTATLKCTDNVGVTAYYWGNTEPTAASSITTTTTADLNSLKSSGGLSKPINAAGTYWLGCKDARGNWEKKSINIYSYTVNNMLQNTSGSTYTTTHYTQASTDTYIAPSGTTIVLTSVYTVPTYSRSGRWNGTSDGVASTTAATINKTNRTLNADNAIYTNWFTRNVLYFKFLLQNDEILQNVALASNGTTVYTWTKNSSNSRILRSTDGGTATDNYASIRQGYNTLDLPDYNNPAYLNIIKNGYTAVNNAQFICVSGCKTSNMTFKHSKYTDFDTSTVCNNLDTADCTVEVKVNWQVKGYTLTYDLSGGSVSSANPTSYNITSNNITLNNPTKIGYDFIGWTEQISGMSWYAGFVNLSSGALGYDSSYPSSYYTDLIYLRAGETYTLSGFGSYAATDIRWRVYNLDGTYVGNGSGSASYTPDSNCYVRIVYYSATNNTSTVRSESVITRTATKTSEIIYQGSTVNRKYIANWDFVPPAAPTITPASTTKIYGVSATTLACATSSTYASGTSIYYEFGWSSTKTGTITWLGSPSTTATKSIGATNHFADRYFHCRVYANNGTISTAVVASLTNNAALIRHNNAKITFDATTNGGTISGTTPLYTRTGQAGLFTGIRNSTAATVPTASKEGSTFNGWYDAATNGNQIYNSTGTLTSATVSGYTASSKWTTTLNRELFAQYTTNCYTITVNAGAGISSLAYSGWTGTGTGTLTKELCYNTTIDLSGFTPTYKAGYSGRANVKTSGAGSISNSTFTVGDGVTTITINATSIETPDCTVGITTTSRIYGSNTTVLTGTVYNTYDSGISVSATYYYDTSASGSYANTQTSTISATSHKGTRYYKAKCVVTGEGSLTSNAMSSNNVSLTLKRAKLTPDANSCGTLSSSNAVYAYKGETKVYTAATGGNETTWPTLTPSVGKEQTGWFSTATGTDKVLNNDGTFSGTAVSGWVTSSAWDATADRSIFAQCQAQSYTITIHYNSNSSNGSFTAATETLSCTAGDDGTCTVDIPSKVLNSKGKVNSSYSGLSSSINSMSRDFSLSITSLTLDSSNSGNQYYAVYASLIPVYRPTSTTTVSRDTSIVIYRNEFFTSTSTMNTVLANADNTITPLTSLSIPVLSGTQVLGLTNIYNSTTYTAVDSLSSTYANFPINQFYVVYGINSSVTFHYYNGSAVATTTADCMNYLIAQNMSQATKAYGTASVPSVVSSSVGANGGSYRGVAASTNSSTTVSSVSVTCRDSVYDSVSPGDWINYTPSKSSYSINGSLTGYSSSQTITPNELTKWRVLRKNSSGRTVDIISQYTSSNAIHFKGKAGYRKLVSSLNAINRQYVNTSYATSVDYSLGYTNQTATINTTTYFKYPAPWTCSTGGSCNPKESYGGGDTGYKTDYNLINSVLGTRKAYSVSATSTAKSYWLASRYYVYNSATDYGWNARFVNSSGGLGNTALHYYNGSELVDRTDNVSLRPVVRLSSNISIGGGTGINSTNAYSLSTVTSSHSYYALYTNPLTVYYPDTSDGVSNSNSSLYRNEYFSSSSAMANVIATTNSSISSASVSSVSLPNLKGTLLGITPTINSAAYETFTSDSIKNSSVTTYYAVTEGEDDATIYYNSNTTEGEITTATANASITSKYYCKTTNTQDVEHGITTSIPDVVRNSIGKYNTTYHGVSNSMNSMNSISFLTGGSSYYANYGGDSKVSSLSLGSYVSYTPSSTSYTTDTAKTGYTSSQTINPSELNLWRVLSVNNDGTVDIISEYTSSVSIYFKGQTAYQNITGYLNELAAQYENSTYTSGSRHFGYNGQTEYITDTTYFTNPAPWTCSTGGTCSPDPDDYEAYGGGDDGYLSDNNLVNNVLGTNIAEKSGTTNKVSYWTASRYYYYLNTSNYYWRARSITTSGSFSNVFLYQYTGDFNSSTSNAYLRPIVKLKANLYCGSGTGASDSPCVLSTSSANNVTEYYYNTSSSSAASRTLYRNEFFTSASAMNTILSNSATGTSNITTSGGAGGSTWYGYATTNNTTRTYNSVAAAAQSTSISLYNIYKMNVTYAIGANVSSIGSTSGSCQMKYNDLSCTITNTPSITPNSGYESVGWSTTNGATTGVTSITLTTNNQTYYANAVNMPWASEFTYDNINTGVDCDDVQCMIDWLSRYKSSLILLPGDYISYTPPSTSYTTDISKTGYTSTQTINPSELNLWRVLAINSNGTVDIISDRVSSTYVYFSGQIGYQNFVGYLNELASQYENSAYTVDSRHFGYNGQTEYITDTSKLTSTSKPWYCDTGETCSPDPDDYESSGGGDDLYINDYNRVNIALGTLTAKRVGVDWNAGYWMASRHYDTVSLYSWQFLLNSLDSGVINRKGAFYYNNGFNVTSNYYSLRPIVTLKSGIDYRGSGTLEDPWTLH